MTTNRDDIGIRLKIFRKDKNLSVPALEKILGIPRDRIYKWEKGTVPYDTADYEKVENLINGKFGISDIIKAPNSRLKKKIGVGLVKFYDTDFAAGDIEFYDDTNSITPAYEMDIPEFAGCTAFRTYGDSMEPAIKSGSILFGTMVVDWESHLEYGQIYGIVCSDKRKYLKYIRKDKDNPKTNFLLRSENKEYDDFELPKNKIKSIWLIHGWINKRN